MRTDEEQPGDAPVYELSAQVLRAGTLFSVLFLLFGTVLAFAQVSRSEHRSHDLAAAWQSLLRMEASGFVEVGLQVLTLTPVLTAGAICIYAIIHRQRSLVLPSVIILAGLALSLWIGIRW